MFINVGEEIMVDTRNEVYLSRQGGSSVRAPALCVCVCRICLHAC